MTLLAESNGSMMLPTQDRESELITITYEGQSVCLNNRRDIQTRGIHDTRERHADATLARVVIEKTETTTPEGR